MHIDACCNSPSAFGGLIICGRGRGDPPLPHPPRQDHGVSFLAFRIFILWCNSLLFIASQILFLFTGEHPNLFTFLNASGIPEAQFGIKLLGAHTFRVNAEENFAF